MTRDVSSDVAGAGPRRPRAMVPAPLVTGPGADGPLDRAPVTFTQHIDGVWLRWSVVEVDARAVPGAQGARCLVFTRQDCIRRVWDFPTDWRALDAAGLAALSWQR